MGVCSAVCRNGASCLFALMWVFVGCNCCGVLFTHLHVVCFGDFILLLILQEVAAYLLHVALITLLAPAVVSTDFLFIVGHLCFIVWVLSSCLGNASEAIQRRLYIYNWVVCTGCKVPSYRKGIVGLYIRARWRDVVPVVYTQCVLTGLLLSDYIFTHKCLC